MCSGSGSSRSSSKVTHLSTMPSPSPSPGINGRPVLQPTSNRNNNNNNNNNGRSTNTNNNNNSSTSPSSNKKLLLPPISPSPSPASSIVPPYPKSRSPKLRGASIDSTTNKKDQVDALFRPPGVRSDLEIITTTTATTTIKKSKSFNGRTTTTTTTMTAIADGGYGASNLMRYSSSSPGSLAAIRREQMALQQAQRKMRIAHYGRSKSARFDSKIVPLDYPPTETQTRPHEEKRCSFITPNSDPLYVAYHDEEWGVPVHDDNLLFELLVLSGAQVGSDWTSILSKRQHFRNTFSGFDAEKVATYSDKQITAISSEYGIDVGQVHGVVDNSKCILKVKREFGSLDKYVWSFVNNKPMATQYKASHKIPVKTSKSESISKDMVRRGFRNVGPTVVLSFMQAAGLTNDHLVTCHCHLKCASLASTPTPASTITLN